MAQRHEQLTIRCPRELMSSTLEAGPVPSRSEIVAATGDRETLRPAALASAPAQRTLPVPNQLLSGLRQWAPRAIYLFTWIRTFLDPDDPADIAELLVGAVADGDDQVPLRR